MRRGTTLLSLLGALAYVLSALVVSLGPPIAIIWIVLHFVFKFW